MNNIRNDQNNDKNEIITISNFSCDIHKTSDVPSAKRSPSQFQYRAVISEVCCENAFKNPHQTETILKIPLLIKNFSETLKPHSFYILRKMEEIIPNKYRITIIGQNMTSCPNLECEDSPRLLNYRNNIISQINNLEKFDRLVLLDLSDNRIEKISGLENLKSLRVLILGGNRISKIEGLQHMPRLNILDLRSNYIERIENLKHLSELRVLNLSDNIIQHVDNLCGLMSLSEINVSRNCIDTLSNISSQTCPNLKRIYLSFNRIFRISDIKCLYNLASLHEISLDNNPICGHNYIRSCIIHTFPQLQLLDSKIITEEEKYRCKQIISRLDGATKTNYGLLSHHSVAGKVHSANNSDSHIQRFNSLKERRRANINKSRKMTDSWGRSERQVSPRLSIKSFNSTRSESSSNPLYVTDTSNNFVNISDSVRDVMVRSLRISSCNQGLTSHKEINNKEFNSIQDVLMKHSQAILPSPREQPSSQLPSIARPLSASSSASKSFISSENAESPIPTTSVDDLAPDPKLPDKINNDIIIEPGLITILSSGALNILTDSLTFNPQDPLCATVTTLVFQGVDFKSVENMFTCINSKFPSIRNIIFQSCNMKCYTEINALAKLQRLDELTVDCVSNPLATFTLLRFYVAFRLAHIGLKRFNNLEITEYEFLYGRRLFLPLAIIGPGQVLQMHLIGEISDTKRRELLLSSNDSLALISMDNCNSSHNPLFTFDLVGKSGLLSTTSFTESDNWPKGVPIGSVIRNVERQYQLDSIFNRQWIKNMLVVISSRLQIIGDSRQEYMRRQHYAVIARSEVHKKAPIIKLRR